MNLFNKMKEDGDNMKQKKQTTEKQLLKEVNQLEILGIHGSQNKKYEIRNMGIHGSQNKNSLGR